MTLIAEKTTTTTTRTTAPADDASQCFLPCIQKNANASKYVECSMSCQDQTCDDSCFVRFCGSTATACDTALQRCDQQCPSSQP